MSKKGELLKLQKELLQIKERVLPNGEADMIEKIQNMPMDKLLDFLAGCDAEEYNVTPEYARQRINEVSMNKLDINSLKAFNNPEANTEATREAWRQRGILLYGKDQDPVESEPNIIKKIFK